MTTPPTHPELSAAQLHRACNPNLLPHDTTADIAPLDSIVGQDRAVRALAFGLEIKSLGFNLYVAGAPGTGKSTAVKRFLDSQAKDKPTPPDWCYVNNFKDPYCPQALQFPPGQARQFQSEMQTLIHHAERDLRAVFDSEDYATQREETLKQLQEARSKLFKDVQVEAHLKDFMLQETPQGVAIVPMDNNRPMDERTFLELPEDVQESVRKTQAELENELDAAFRQANAIEKQAISALNKLNREVALATVAHLLADVTHNYAHLPAVQTYLQAVQADILDHVEQFTKDDTPAPPPAPVDGSPEDSRQALLNRYAVNVVVDNSGLTGAPVIMELNPTYTNLFGRIEKEAQYGAMVTDFTMIRAGFLHHANGGYLVLNVTEVLQNPLSWDSLKRALRNQEITIEEPGERLGYMTTKTLRPDPIPLAVKVVLIGGHYLHQLLYQLDEDFSELFKVKADFDTEMSYQPETIAHYAAFAANLCHTELLKDLNREALVQVVEYGSRLVAHQEKLSTKFGQLADVIREANFYASQQDAPCIAANHIEQAISERRYRSSLVEERLREGIITGQVLVDVVGEAVGQVNGLAVLSSGGIAFGRPSRITASVGLGQAGVINIEQEAELSGPLHTKGVLILSGFLSENFAQQVPLSLSARLVFEQSYGGIDGDSASSAELYALLSALAGVPLKQSLAVTGSVNQKGQVQAIGGVNEKIEGFFDVCRAQGLTGSQGVLIPASNVKHLMLKHAVVEAVETGQFHIWAVESIAQGLEILTGLPAGSRQADGSFPDESIFGRVEARLLKLAERLREFRSR